jgi:hypothetical protein
MRFHVRPALSILRRLESAPAPLDDVAPVHPPPEPPGTWWRHLAVLGWMALFLGALEIAAEVRAYRRGWDTLLFGHGGPPASNVDLGLGPTEAFPFRSRIVPVERAPGTLRIWVASASYAMGGNLSADATFPVRMGDLLRARGVTAEVLNAGRVGVTTRDNTQELAADGPRWKPDVVVLYQMSTDVDELSRLLLGKRGLTEASGAEGLDWGSRLIEETTLQPLLKEHVSSRVTLARPLVDTLGAAGERAFEERVRAFVAAVRALGAKPVLCTFATSHARTTPGQIPLHVFRFNIRVSRTGWHDTVDAWNRVLAKVAAEENVPLVDVAGALLGRTDAFVDFVHFTAGGHERVAALLADGIAPAGGAGGGGPERVEGGGR